MAFSPGDFTESDAKIGIFAGSLAAALVGAAVLWVGAARRRAITVPLAAPSRDVAGRETTPPT